MDVQNNNLVNLANLTGIKQVGHDVASIADQVRHVVDTGSESTAVNPTNTKNDFLSVLKASLNEVSGADLEANALRDAYVQGNDKVNLSQVMLSVQKASLEFQSLLAVRNKIIAAYQDIMNMPV